MTKEEELLTSVVKELKTMNRLKANELLLTVRLSNAMQSTRDECMRNIWDAYIGIKNG